ncbi:MAG TPA: DegT/DnrJ/EryC1/StrS family aminotransferase [Acidimicrobiales bacterium]|nr:DegT/DnrJ/EryC1/StrS family aminotransferase [Acidimicrobiales bacterium]
MTGRTPLPILPLAALTEATEAELLSVPETDPFGADERHSHFGPSGRWLLGAWLSTVVGRRSEEIAILTTSDETYVSTCVTIAAFNHGRVSRLVTGDTVAVVVIHEFGYVFADIAERCAEWRARGLAVLEDCAHLVGTTPEGERVGIYGDAALYSLPKVLPAPSGGLLRTRGAFTVPSMDAGLTACVAAGREAAERHLGRTWWLNERRLRRHALLAERCPTIELAAQAVPWATSVAVPSRAEAEETVTGVEWVATLRDDRVVVPTNPCVEEVEFTRVADRLASLTTPEVLSPRG